MLWEWMTQNAEKLAAAVLGLGGVMAAMWQWLLKARTERAKTGADVAIAESQRSVFEQMEKRLEATDVALQRCLTEIDSLRAEVRERDSKIHALELYVKDLQHELQKHGIDVPPMR